MKKLLFAVTMAICSAGELCAQDIVGTGQGTLQPPQGQALRIVGKITRENDQLKMAFYSIDQGGQPMNASTFTFDPPNLKAAVPGVGGNYEGRLKADGNTITGTWTQGAPIPLNLTRATPETAWA